MASDKSYQFELDIAERRDEAIRRAFNVLPKPMSAYVGKSERAKKTGKSRVKKSDRKAP